MKKITYVDTEAKIEDFSEHIRKNSVNRIALDFEGESNLYRYGLHLCLVQIFDGNEYFVIDPIADIDFNPVKEILENEKIIKVMCAPDFDIKLLKKAKSVCIKRVYDVQLAAKMMGEQQVSYKNLVEVVTGVELSKSKKKQKANWNIRPIKENLITYAVEDVEYLFQIMEHFEFRLKAENKWEQFLESCRQMEHLEITNENSDYKNAKGIGALNREQLKIFKRLFNIREKIAKKIDRPVFHIFQNKQLIEIAKNYPQNSTQWEAYYEGNPVARRYRQQFEKNL